MKNEMKTPVGYPVFCMTRMAVALLCLFALPVPGFAAETNINSTVGGPIYGATSPATGGVVNINTGANVTGDSSTGHVAGGAAADDNATNNRVNFNGGNVSGWTMGGVVLSGTGNATDNEITLNDNTGGGIISGGRVMFGVTGNADNNRVVVHGGTWDAVYGGYNEGTGNSNGNTVTMYGGSVDLLNGGRSVSVGDSSGNTVIVYGGTVNTIYGGSSISADNNTVTIYEGVIINVGLQGGTFPFNTNNTLNLHGWTGTLTFLHIFQNYNFYLPGTAQNGDTIVTVTNLAVNMNDAVVQVGIEGSSSALGVGDTVTLIDARAGLTATGINMQGVGMQGLSLFYDFNLSYDANKLYATVAENGVQENPQIKVLLEGQSASAAFVGQGGELVAGSGLQNALAAARGANGGAFTFGSMSGGTSRYHTGSHVDVDGFSLMAGFGWNLALNEGKNGTLLLAPFLEAGWGSYDSYNSFSHQPSVRGDGDISYYGGGLLARYDSPVNIYAEVSLRMGRVETDFRSGDIRNAVTGDTADYETSAVYYGAHLGLGYLWNICELLTLDVYTKYLWTRQEGDSVTMAGEKYTFEGIDSHRWRNGARLSYDVVLDSGVVFSPYIGAAFDYEFDSRAKGSVNGRKIDSPDIMGATGMGELGLSFKPSATGGLSLDLGLQGYTGKREGVAGSFQMKFAF